MTGRLFKRKKRYRDPEAGAYYVMMAVGLVGLLSLSGFALDLALIFREQNYLQKAADVAVLAGLSHRINIGPTVNNPANSNEGQLVGEITNRAKAIGDVNLRLADIPTTIVGLGGDAIVPTYTSLDSGNAVERLTVTATSNLDLYIMDLIPWGILGSNTGGFNNFQVDATAVGELRPAHVQILADVSGSMVCPTIDAADTAGECPCLDPTHPFHVANPPYQTCADRITSLGTTSKAFELQSAIETFLDRFRESYDRIGLLKFNIRANVIQSIQDPFDNRQDTKNLVNNLVSDARSNTNPSDAFIEAYQNALPLLNNDATINMNYVFFTDGAPTAARFLFNNILNLPPNNPAGIGNYDYINYKLEWAPVPNPIPADWTNSGAGFEDALWKFGPSALVETQDLILGYNQGTPPAGSTPPCTSQTSDSILRWDAFTTCIGSLSSSTIGGGTFGPGIMNHPRWVEQYYNATLAAADFMVSNRGTIYVVGQGIAPASDFNLLNLSGAQPDPYQNAHKDFTRKDYFLARVANDPFAERLDGGTPAAIFGTPVNAGDLPPNLVEFNDSNLPTGLGTWTQLDDLGEEAKGEYLPTTNAAEITALFNRIARKILLRLIAS